MELFGVYGILCFAIASLWINAEVNRNKVITLMLLFVSVLFAVIFKRIEIYTVLSGGILFFMSGMFHKFSGYKFWWGAAFVISSALLMFHIIPGFHNFVVIHNFKIDSNSIPYTLYLNFDKALVGISFLFFTSGLIKNKDEVKGVLLFSAKSGVVTVFVVLLLSYALGYIRFSAKVPCFYGYFLMANLFFTCLPEEIIFRGIIQTSLKGFFTKFKMGTLWAIAITSVLFGAMHFAGGYKYVLLASVAGFGYGWVYEKTGKIESAVFVHFMLNVVHFFFFTYPALSTAF